MWIHHERPASELSVPIHASAIVLSFPTCLMPEPTTPLTPPVATRCGVSEKANGYVFLTL